MINRINLILQAKNITAKQFAEEIGIQPSGMSHILSGRNNPSLEFVNKVIRRYPEIDANWLLLGKGQMYASGAIESPAVSEPTLFAPPPPSPATVYTPVPEQELASEPVEEEREEIRETENPRSFENREQSQACLNESRRSQDLPDLAKVEREQENGEEKKEPAPEADNGRRLVKILFFYDDHSFSEYRPE